MHPKSQEKPKLGRGFKIWAVSAFAVLFILILIPGALLDVFWALISMAVSLAWPAVRSAVLKVVMKKGYRAAKPHLAKRDLDPDGLRSRLQNRPPRSQDPRDRH